MEITAEGVQARLGGADILRGVDLRAGAGDFVGVIGPNGSGKSTLLKCIYRVLQPSAGAVYLDGRSLEACSFRESAKRVAVLAQHNFYNFDFTVQDVVLMGRAPHKKALERDNAQDYHIVREALETVGMESFRTRSFSSLSGGEQQRVILARALAQQTPCLVLDEPTNHLDIKYQIQLLRFVKRLPCMTIAALHDLNLAAMFCDRLYLMHKGRVMAHGSPQEVLTKQNIETVYEVPVTVTNRPDGRLNVLYEV